MADNISALLLMHAGYLTLYVFKVHHDAYMFSSTDAFSALCCYGWLSPFLIGFKMLGKADPY